VIDAWFFYDAAPTPRHRHWTETERREATRTWLRRRFKVGNTKLVYFEGLTDDPRVSAVKVPADHRTVASPELATMILQATHGSTCSVSVWRPETLYGRGTIGVEGETPGEIFPASCAAREVQGALHTSSTVDPIGPLREFFSHSLTVVRADLDWTDVTLEDLAGRALAEPQHKPVLEFDPAKKVYKSHACTRCGSTIERNGLCVAQKIGAVK